MKYIIVTIFGIMLTGCSYYRNIFVPEEENYLSGAGSILVDNDGDPIDTIDIENLKLEYGFTKHGVTINNNEKKYEDFSDDDINNKGFILKRNDLQQYIISISNQKCSAYIRTLMNERNMAKTGWTSISLMLSGAATVFTPASTVRALAAGSTAATGVNSTYDQAYFNSLATNIISAGISKKREDILTKITGHKNDNLLIYPVNQAISDAIDYHAQCTMVSGMEQASAELTK